MSNQTSAITKADFADEESQFIFEERKAFYQTEDWKHLVKIVGGTYHSLLEKFNLCKKSKRNELLNFIAASSKEVIVFGCGLNGKKTYKYMLNVLGIQVAGFCDNNKAGEKYDETPILSVDDVVKLKEAVVIIPFGTYAHEMKDQLKKQGYNEEKIFLLDIDQILSAEINIVEKEHLDQLLLDENQKFVLYGTSHYEFLLTLLFKKAGVNLVAVCRDGAYESDTFHDVPVIDIETYKENYEDCFIICQSYNYVELTKLIEKKDNVIGLINIDYLQYFDKELVKKDSRECQVFIDGGCFDMGTAHQFMEWSGRNCEKIYAFEPDQKNYELCKEILGNDINLQKKVNLIKKGLWDKETSLHFNAVEISGASYIDETDCPNVKLHQMKVNDIETVECTAVDQVLKGEKATFIKMDVEGSELKALQGAKETIVKYKPILAISIYHKPEDIVEIPAYIKSIVPEYQLYIRCYHTDHTETVLYAFCD